MTCVPCCGRAAPRLAASLQLAAESGTGDALRGAALAYRENARAYPGTYAARQAAPTAMSSRLPRPRLWDQSSSCCVAMAWREERDGRPAVRAIRPALHGFVSFEREGAFGLPVAINDSYDILVRMLDAGLAAAAPGPGRGANR